MLLDVELQEDELDLDTQQMASAVRCCSQDRTKTNPRRRQDEMLRKDEDCIYISGEPSGPSERT